MGPGSLSALGGGKGMNGGEEHTELQEGPAQQGGGREGSGHNGRR